MRRDLIEDARRYAELAAAPSHGEAAAPPKKEAAAAWAVRIDAAFEEMAGVHPEWCAIVELKFYLGLTDDEVAHTLGSRIATLQRQWQDARWWLFRKAEVDAW